MIVQLACDPFKAKGELGPHILPKHNLLQIVA